MKKERKKVSSFYSFRYKVVLAQEKGSKIKTKKWLRVKEFSFEICLRHEIK